MSKKKIQKYELSYLLDPQLEEKEVKEKQNKLESKIKDKGGELLEQEDPKETNLAYPIEKRTVAFLGTFYFKMEKQNFPEFREEFKETGGVLRFLPVKRETGEKSKSKSKRKKKVSKKKKKSKKSKKKEKEKKKVDLDQIEEELGEIINKDKEK